MKSIIIIIVSPANNISTEVVVVSAALFARFRFSPPLVAAQPFQSWIEWGQKKWEELWALIYDFSRSQIILLSRYERTGRRKRFDEEVFISFPS